MIRFEQTEYKGWPTCYRATDGRLELIVTTDVGPRIIRFGLVDGPNMLKEFDAQLGKTGGDEWRNYGGHRFWHAPEQRPRTYYPDNNPVAFEQHDGFARIIQPTETTTHIQKELDIRLADGQVTITHRLRNRGVWPVELAPWALTVMAAGGTAIIPLPPRQSHTDRLLPVNTLTMWAYTDMSDPRWTWGRKYVLLQQHSGEDVQPQKVGAWVPAGWVAYVNAGQCFIKHFTLDETATYPDLNSNVETFTNKVMLEVETLGPLTRLDTGEIVEHVETWQLADGVATPTNDAEVDDLILPLLAAD